MRMARRDFINGNAAVGSQINDATPWREGPTVEGHEKPAVRQSRSGPQGTLTHEGPGRRPSRGPPGGPRGTGPRATGPPRGGGTDWQQTGGRPPPSKPGGRDIQYDLKKHNHRLEFSGEERLLPTLGSSQSPKITKDCAGKNPARPSRPWMARRGRLRDRSQPRGAVGGVGGSTRADFWEPLEPVFPPARGDVSGAGI